MNTTYKQNLKAAQEGLRHVDLLTQKNDFAAAQRALCEVMNSALGLVKDLHVLEVCARIDAHFAQALLDNEKLRQPERAVTPEDQTTIVELTKQGCSMREIGRLIARSPSFVWYWQRKLGVKKGARP